MIMNREPDDGALRVRRSRRHRAGDHSLCLPGRCADLRRLEAAQAALDVPAAERERSLADIVGELVAALTLGDATDVRHALAATALRVARQMDATGASAPLVREMRVTLHALAGPVPADAEPDFVDVLRAKRALRRAAHEMPVDGEFAPIIEALRRSDEFHRRSAGLSGG
jgi:hypothetical protein